MEDLQRRGASIIAVTCDGESPLARGSDLALVLTAAVEQAIATTRSLTGMILASQCLAAIVSRDEAYLGELRRLADIFDQRLNAFQELGKRASLAPGLTRLAFVGNGAYYGLARESQLKTKEMTLTPADAYPMLDFRHGPKSNVDEHMLVVAFITERARTLEIQFLKEMHALGGITWAICERAGGELDGAASFTLELDSGLSDLARSPLYMPAIQYMAYFLALAKGLNPDQPRNLSYWVEIA
jgi:glucosamine--fructose-6-phosphate aminotransferase (isomerizing)